MSTVRWTLIALALLVLPGATAPARGQVPSGNRVAVAINPYVGVFVFDDSELEDDAGLEVDIGPILGGRVVAVLDDDWRVEGAYGYASATVERSEFLDFPESEIENDLAIHLLYGAANYLISNAEVRTRLLLSAGAGILLVDPEVGDVETEFMVTLGAGFTHPVNEWITFRGEFRDHVSFCSAPERAVVPVAERDFSPCFGDEALHHFEFSGGLEFWIR